MYIARTLVHLLLGRPLVGVRAVPLLADGRVVLVRQRRGGWVLPGGLLDLGEKIRPAVAREVREESGLTVHRFGRLVGVYSDPLRDPRFHSLCILMEVFVEGEIAPQDIDEIVEARPFHFDALPADLADDCREQLAHYLAGGLVID